MFILSHTSEVLEQETHMEQRQEPESQTSSLVDTDSAWDAHKGCSEANTEQHLAHVDSKCRGKQRAFSLWIHDSYTGLRNHSQ